MSKDTPGEMSNHEQARRILESLFPRLPQTGYRITSPADVTYNCIAWAAGQQDRWWWPADPLGLGYFWPPGVVAEETIAAFIQVYETLGYAPANNDGLEVGVEKIALYALNGKPTHVARQLANGLWTSKLGKFLDIEHTLEGLVSPHYGSVVQMLQRPGGPAEPLPHLTGEVTSP